MKCHSALKRKGIITYTTTRMDLGDVIPSKSLLRIFFSPHALLRARTPGTGPRRAGTLQSQSERESPQLKGKGKPGRASKRGVFQGCFPNGEVCFSSVSGCLSRPCFSPPSYHLFLNLCINVKYSLWHGGWLPRSFSLSLWAPSNPADRLPWKGRLLSIPLCPAVGDLCSRVQG